MNIFFNSSMPRSGSTLLQNILGNNPQIYATPTSGLIEYIVSAQKTYSSSQVIKSQDEDAMKRALLSMCGFSVYGYFDALTSRQYAIDKSRGWMCNLSFLRSFFPKAKIICMVRDLRDILASMEKIHRETPEYWERGNEEGRMFNIYDRIDYWMEAKPIGPMYKALFNVFETSQTENILFIKHEKLCSNPDATMKIVYDFLDMPHFTHDFNNIVQVTHEDDKWHGKYGKHGIRQIVEPTSSKAKELLGNGYDYVSEKYGWYFNNFGYDI